MIDFFKSFFKSKNISKKGICSICAREFKDKELTLISDLALCKNDLKVYNENTWDLVKTGESNPEDPSAALEIQDLKDSLKLQLIPSFIKVYYSEKNTQIISHFQLYIPTKLKENYNKHTS